MTEVVASRQNTAYEVGMSVLNAFLENSASCPKFTHRELYVVSMTIRSIYEQSGELLPMEHEKLQGCVESLFQWIDWDQVHYSNQTDSRDYKQSFSSFIDSLMR